MDGVMNRLPTGRNPSWRVFDFRHASFVVQCSAMAVETNEILIFDGAVGTELYERGFYINRPFEELNLSAPADVIAVHENYIKAGAQVITTNTFSITGPQLKKFDVESNQEALLIGGLRNAFEARKRTQTEDSVKIGLSIGPLGVLVEPLGSYALTSVRDDFARVAELACAATTGQKKMFDLYILETFSNLDEFAAAIDGIRRVDRETPVLASLSVKSSQIDTLMRFAAIIGGRGDVQYLGLNCSEGPSDLLTSLTRLRPLTDKPIIVQPNAGTPRQLNGRYFYMTSADYMGKYAKRFIDAGAAGVGGCCGTGPDHIRAIRGTVRMMTAKQVTAAPQVEVRDRATKPEAGVRGRTTLSERTTSYIGRKLKAGEKVVTIEMLPPKGTNATDFLDSVEKLIAAGVSFVNIPDGARAMTRAGSLHMAAAVQLQSKGRIRAIPHLTTRDRNLIALQSDVIGAYMNGVSDILLITGDPPKLGNNREATAVYDIDSIGLTYLVDCLNRGVTPGGDNLGKAGEFGGTAYGIGVASNPTATNLELEIKRWGYKVESGADYAVTQPIFDRESFLTWKDRIGSVYRPHIVGLWPLISLRNAEFMANEVPGVKVPAWVLREMEKAGDNKEEAIKRGLEIAAKTMRELAGECEGFCISAPLGKTDVALALVQGAGL